ncbi:hypothetical protein [Flavobacterium humi]|uniref:Transmembrane protein n=1 Tax=Flavobacterium humi TaxID=2562683 RepID=A0A4Z0LA75_9FLAO|nr:hypothetical protein [Flavobacterium humi]TGD58140.1 hypothetical protein E4635_09040 [Flavobacterium humi]
MKYLDKLLDVYPNERDSFQIISWWELRRILYNLIVLVCGIASMSLTSLLVNAPPGQDMVEPFAIMGFGIACNLGYTLGWLTELFVKNDPAYGPKMFKTGLYFTLFFIFLPLAIHIVMCFARGFKTMY